MKARSLVFFLILIFWPISLIIHNQSSELFTFVAPAILMALAYKYYKQNCWYYVLPLLLIPFVSPKLTLIPIIYLGIDLLAQTQILKQVQNDRVNDSQIKTKLLICFILSVLVLAINWSQFFGQTIFVPDYEAGQKVIRDQQLYPDTFTARLFHNKARIVIDKANANFFAIVDPNNYFFGFAPRQIVENQNLQKFPFMTLPFFVFGLYYFWESKERKFLIISLTAIIINLTLVNNFDKNDFVLLLPLLLIIFAGMNNFEERFKKFYIYYYLFIAFSTVELVRLFV